MDAAYQTLEKRHGEGRQAATQRIRRASMRIEPARAIAAVLTIVDGLIHFGVAPEHFEEALEFGLFMVVAGAAQLAAGLLLLLRPTRALVTATLLGTLVLLAVHTFSRTTGLPFGPHPGEPEEVQAIDLVSKTIELALLAVLVRLAGRRVEASGLPAS